MTRLAPNTPKTILTLSAEPELLPEDARSATVIGRLLARIARANRQAAEHREQHKRLTDELIEYVWPEVGSLRDERDPPITDEAQLARELVGPMSESELRALWGDR